MVMTRRVGLILLLSVLLCNNVFASEYCTTPPEGVTTVIDHNGDWYNITITMPSCFSCVDNGAGYGDVECSPCVVSSFRSNVTCGIVPFQVQFNDTSTGGGITDYYWDFSGGNTSIEQNPVQWYNVTGVYGVDHSATNPINTYWTNRTNYITARAVGDTCFGGGGGGTSTGQANLGGEVMWLAFGLVGGAVGLLILSRR